MPQKHFMYDVNATIQTSITKKDPSITASSPYDVTTLSTLPPAEMVNSLSGQSTEAIIAQLMIVACILAVSISGNTLILLSMYKVAYIRSISSYLVANLALIDLGLSLLIMPTVALIIANHGWDYSQGLCIASGCVDTLLTNAQVMALLAICINRYTAMRYPHWYNSTKGKRFSVVCVLLGWIYSVLWSVPPLLNWGQYTYTPGTIFCGLSWKSTPYFAVSHLLASFVIPSFTGLYFYVGVVRAVFKYVKQVGVSDNTVYVLGRHRGTVQHRNETFVERKNFKRSIRMNAFASSVEDIPKQATMQTPENALSRPSVANGRSHQLQRLYQVTKAFLIIALTFGICWIPRGIANIWAVSQGRSSVPLKLEIYSTLLIFSTSALNPIVYGFCRADFRKAFKTVACCAFQDEH